MRNKKKNLSAYQCAFHNLYKSKLLFLFMIIPLCSFGELSPEGEAKIDSLKQVIATTALDTIKIKAWETWAGLIEKSNAELNIELNENILNLTEETLKGQTENE